MPPVLAFNIVPLLTSLVVALGGLFLGWLVYRGQRAGQPDPIQVAVPPVHKFLQNKWYIDEIYNVAFIRPSIWISEVFTFQWMDRTVIDGILHFVAFIASNLGTILRNYFDKPVINGFGDAVGEGVKSFGRRFRVVQTGKIQQYMLVALVFAFGTLFYYLFSVMK